MAAIDGSIVIISLPAIFNGIKLNPLEPGNISYLLWIFMGYLLVTAVLVVAFGRLGDIYGRVRMYNARLPDLHDRRRSLLALDAVQGPGRGDLADRDAHRAGRRRRVPVRQLRRRS